MLQFLGEAEYKPLTLFYDYWKLPKLKIKWTSWLLYSIVNLYSKSYKTAVSSNYIADAVPLVVREGVEIDKNELEQIRPEMYSEYSDDEDDFTISINSMYNVGNGFFNQVGMYVAIGVGVAALLLIVTIPRKN